MSDDRIERDILIDATPEHVWFLVNQPGFWVAEEASLPGTVAREGETTLARNATYGDYPVRVERVSPPSAVAYRWAPAFPGADLADDNSTLVEVSIAREGEKARVTVVESGFAALPDEVRDRTREANSEGWPQVMQGLGTRAERPSEDDFTTSFVVDESPDDVFAAVLDVRGWWTDDIEGPTGDVGDVFVFRHTDVHYSKLLITEVVPGRRVTWLVLDTELSFVEDTTEWINTSITFEVTPTAAGTEVRFTHHGLVPAYECYDACSSAWGFYLVYSMRSLIVTGAGMPALKALPRPF
ncbi:SRPBCC family protein [Cellulomonas sp. PhB150]|uniref:SRPBCC family protein n=1 Tax=Cellulomonas sp. PhB150 TaxID=2485188 RepID=UPI000FA85C76|nr:SRPBCC family protein [Cellulomonas sp. PhB150]ROS31344.1 uncharacterized protein YndB with AHSA1/START domain [Cellulomonas sp. PhB150]